ncbi:MAG TPA: cytochrome P450 [Candidatus Angelobacter sp.]|nr:cytochrome P450 [Candidatus Angelobacter sp.]
MTHPLPPGPVPLPDVGNSLEYRKDRLGFVTRQYETYGPTSTMYFGTTPVVLISRPTTIRKVLVDESNKFSKGEYVQNRALFSGDTTLSLHHREKAPVARCCGCGQEQSLFSTDGEAHDRARSSLLEAFHGPAMERYRQIMVDHTREMLAGWEVGRELELTGAMQRLAASIVFETLFGINIQERSADIVQAYKSVLKHSDALYESAKSAEDARKEEAWSGLMALVDEIVQGAAARNADGKSTLLVDLILRGAPASRANDTVRDQVTAFMGAGQVTVSSLLIWAISLLAQHPDVLSKVTEEVCTVLNGAAPLTTDMPRMPYLDWVVKEALRLYPTVWMHGRRAMEDVQLEDWHLAAGTFVFFSEWITQRSDEYFSEPLKFIPERFAPKSPYLHTPMAYFPFGMGARACIGTGFAILEAKVVLSLVLQHFLPVLTDGGQLSPNTFYAFLQPRGEVTIKLERVPTQKIEAVTAV